MAKTLVAFIFLLGSFCAAQNTITTVDSAGGVGGFTSIASPQDGLPVVSYHDLTNSDLKVLKCGNASCASGNTITVMDTWRSVGTYTSIAVPQDGLPVVSYFGANEGLKVLKCGNATCASGNTITVMDATRIVGFYTSIAIPQDGLPVVSYHDFTNGDLKVLKCGNVFCSSGKTITTVDAGGSVGTYTSIAVPSDGLPVVSYFDLTNDDLKVLKCGNASCSSGNTITTVDARGRVGEYTSIAVPADGLPVVSYFDLTNDDLKVLKCSRPDCSETSSALRRTFNSEHLFHTSMSGGVLTISTERSGMVQIFDVFGQKVFGTMVSKSSRLEVPNLMQGIHFIHLTSHEGVFVHKVFVLY